MTTRAHRWGFTLIEVVLTVTIIGLLAAFLVPSISLVIRNRENVECTRKLRAAVEAFETYASEHGGTYPADIAAMEDYYFPYFKIDWWSEPTELGGGWGWNVGQDGVNLSISINAPTKSGQQMTELDRLIDDGNCGTGKFRQVGTRYHYIIED